MSRVGVWFLGALGSFASMAAATRFRQLDSIQFIAADPGMLQGGATSGTDTAQWGIWRGEIHIASEWWPLHRWPPHLALVCPPRFQGVYCGSVAPGCRQARAFPIFVEGRHLGSP